MSEVALTPYPPLDQITVLSGDQVWFTVHIALPSEKHQCEGLQLDVWHNCTSDGAWSSLSLREISDLDDPVVVCNQRIRSAGSWFFAGELKGQPGITVDFTFRWKCKASQDWVWSKDCNGKQDGQIIFQIKESISNDIAFYLREVDASLSIDSVSCDATTCVWTISHSVDASEGDDAGQSNISIGAVDDALRWFAIVRGSIPWLVPRQGKLPFSLNDDAIFCSFLRQDGLHIVILAVTSDTVTTLLKSTDEGKILVSSRNDDVSGATAQIVIAVGREFERAVAHAMAQAKAMINPESATDRNLAINTAISSRKKQEFNKWYDGLTYCTWNGLGQDLSQDKILQGLKHLQEAGIDITNLIIDDNWQSLDNAGSNQVQRGWKDFDADKSYFPDGLKGLTSSIRSAHPLIENIAVWHGLIGYWGGFSDRGDIADRYLVRQVMKIAEGFGEGKERLFNVVDQDDIGRMYDDFYNFLDASGINAVKTDTQYLLDCIKASPERRNIIKAYQSAWLKASKRCFSTTETFRVISCMSLFPHAIFQSQMTLPSKQAPLLLRSSDDFFPDDLSSHTWHIFCNAHNAVLLQHLPVLLDWDMFQTVHDFSSFHAAARCISGGPIYITDEPGKHDKNLIGQMTGRRGRRRVILRPTSLGRSVQVYNDHTDGVFCKVKCEHTILVDDNISSQTRNISASSDLETHILGLFNTSRYEQQEIVSMLDFYVASAGQSYLLHRHSTNELSGPILFEKTAVPAVFLSALPDRGFDILTLHPVYHADGFDVSILGLVSPCQSCIDRPARNEDGPSVEHKSKFTGIAAVTAASCSYTEEDNEVSSSPVFKIRVTVKALSDVLSIWLRPGQISQRENNEQDASARVIEIQVHVYLASRTSSNVFISKAAVESRAADQGGTLISAYLDKLERDEHVSGEHWEEIVADVEDIVIEFAIKC